jgi:hypothetical protein
MSSLAISLIVTGLITGSGVLGLVLQRVLPERYTSDKARDMIGGVVGQLTLLLVLVNGLLIWTAYGVYSTQQTELQTLAARALEFDLEMRQFGPEADEARSMLRTDLVWAHEQFWGDDTSRAAAYEASYKASRPRRPRRQTCFPPRARTTPSSASNASSCRCRRRPRFPGLWSMP